LFNRICKYASTGRQLDSIAVPSDNETAAG
jgi:hypothetical protein